MTQRYAIVNGSGVVVNTIQWNGTSAWTPPSGCSAVQSNTAGIGYTYSGGVFTPPYSPPPSYTPAQQAQMALDAGINLTSSSTPALDGTYAVNQSAISNLSAVTLYIVVNGTFPSGSDTMLWQDTSAEMHEFPDVDLFKEFASAIADYVSQVTLYRDSNGAYGVLESPNLVIS
jgi:hypothetical protein